METLTTTRYDQSVEEVVKGMFQPDGLLEYDYFETLRRSAPLEPEKNLMLAVLEDAINVYRLYAFVKTGHKRKLFLDTQRWFRESGDSWPFSFEYICEVLGFDAEYLRAGLRQWMTNRPSASSSHDSASARAVLRRAA